MKQYLDLMQEVLQYGELKEPARPGMPRTLELFGRMMKFDLQKGFPLLTTKKMHYKGIIAELLWFLSGSTNVYDLNKMGCKIWNDDAYKFYLKKAKQHSLPILNKEEWTEKLNSSEIINDFTKWFYFGCGSIYGEQWRKFGTDFMTAEGGFDQISNLINSIKEKPNSRYHIVSAWNPVDFLAYSEEAALPACHMLFQCSVRENRYLDMSLVIRSNDLFLGAPYNIASYAFLNHMIADVTGYIPGEITYFVNSAHLYENHIDQTCIQLERKPMELPKLNLKHRDSIFDFQIDDFQIEDYNSHPSIKAPLSVGI